ncbi:MAG: protein kinase [Nitrososphaeraceae archaeon]|nr:protein kinase [Nitrososphaeraceae archaeon]
MDGRINDQNINHKQWNRLGCQKVALKSLIDNSSLNFLKEVESNVQIAENPFFIQCLGISQDPQTLNYMIVMEFAPLGSLRTYMNDNFNSMTWQDKIKSLWSISKGLYYLHDKNLIHQDFHPGNLLFSNDHCLNITDLGLCKSANQNTRSNGIYGVLPYVAPEVLHRKDYTMASDIYSFGIVTYELITGIPPYHNIKYDSDLALNICQGLRPKIPSNVPPLLTKLIMECWNAQPDKRPTSKKLFTIINKWRWNNNVFDKFKSSPSNKLHSQAIYTSKFIDTSNISLPVIAALLGG